MPAEIIAEHVLITAGIHVLERISHVKFVKCHLWKPNVEVRVSISAILAITDGGRYLLIRNLRRPESFGPIGGVYKHLEEAQPELEATQFRPEGIDAVMKNDLRGFLPRRRLGRFLKWFERKDDREMPGDCLRRELREELSEIGLGTMRVPAQLALRRVRRVCEGPERVPGQQLFLYQFRLFEVFALVPLGRQMEVFIRTLLGEAESHPDLLLASAPEIVVGRSADNRMITQHSAYVVGKRRFRPETPTFSRSAGT
jgi:hypothetical protein